MFNLPNHVKKRLFKVPVKSEASAKRSKADEDAKKAKKEKIKFQAEHERAPENPDTVPKSIVCDIDVLNIYSDISKLSSVEQYLNVLYRPYMCSMRSKCNYKLDDLDSFLPKTRYDPRKYLALIVHQSNPKCTLKVYENGIISCQGYCYKSAALGIKSFYKSVRRLGYSPVFSHPKFNVVNATFCLPFGLNLSEIYEEYQEDCLFNPRTQPYLTFKVQEAMPVKMAIFPSGFVFVLLCFQPSYIHKAISLILPILYRHRCSDKKAEKYRKQTELSMGDVNFKLLWERKFQRTYQNGIKYY